MMFRKSVALRRKLTIVPVDQPLFYTLLSDCVLRQTFYSPPVPENLRAQPKGKHGPLHCNTTLHLELLHDVPCGDHLRHCSMYPTCEDLEPINDHGPLHQHQRRILFYCDIQRYYRLRNLDPSNASSLEITDAPEKEVFDDSSVCDGFPVSTCGPIVLSSEKHSPPLPLPNP